MNSILHLARQLSVLGLGLLLVSGCGKKHESAEATQPRTQLTTVPVQVRAAESKNQVLTEEVVGTIRAKVHATLEAKLSGRILEMPVVLGQQVQNGKLVARLDAAEIKARFDQAKATLEQAQRDWKRIVELFNRQAVTQSEYDSAEARERVAKAGLAEAQAMMSYVEVKAPFDGVVAKKWADVGDLASPGKPLIEIEDPSVLQLEADVPEAIASRIKANAQLLVRIDSTKKELSGTVSEMALSADPTSRTFRVKVALPQTQDVMPGQFARLVVPVGDSNSVRVPAAAVVQRGQMEIVFVVANGRAQLHLVKSAKRIGDDLEIVSGLDGGDQVVVDNAAQLADGQPVEVK